MKNLKLVFIAIPFSTLNLISFSGKGSGTAADPYQIITIYNFNEIDYDSEGYYILMNDIDATDNYIFVNNFFSGLLNGDGHIIKHAKNCGLFSACLGCTIKKLGVEYDTVYCNDMGGITQDLSAGGLIEECYTNGVLIGYYNGGGAAICPIVRSALIINCYSSCTLMGHNDGFGAGLSGPRNSYFSGFCDPVETYFFDSPNQNYKGYDCFWNKDFYSDIDTFKYSGIPKTTAEMMMKSTYEGWYFDNVWCIDEGKDYPRLRAFNKCGPAAVEDKPKSAEAFKIEISPNPASDYISISVGAGLALPKLEQINIYNIFGENVVSLSAIQESPLRIDISSLPSGIYNITLKTETNSITKPIMIIK